MAKQEDLPPLGMPLQPNRGSGYFFRILSALIICGAIGYGAVYAWLELSHGACGDRYAEALADLDAEIDFYRETGPSLGLGSPDLQALRTGARMARESLLACCKQLESGDGATASCDAYGDEIATIAGRLAAAHDHPFRVLTTAANRLRGISADLDRITARASAANVAAPPPAGR